uniref:EamA family transporter n=1 Tax=uncultured Sphingomonas sp. TaxID=158754 RepID=UPI0035C9BFFB
MSRTPAALAALIASMVSLCVGTSYAKGLFPVAGAAGVTALRLGLSAALLVMLQRPWRWHVTRAGWAAAARYGVVLGCMNLSFYQALRTLPLGVAIAIEFLGPLGVAIWFSARRLDFVWIAIAAFGIALLVLPGAAGHPISLTGVAFALLAALFWALYIVTGKRASEVLPEGQVVCLGLLFASAVAVPVGIASAGAALRAPSVLAAGLVVAVLCSAIPYSLEMFALKRMPSQVFGVGLSLEPAIGALAAFAILGERLGLMQWVAIGAVLIASCGSALSRPAPPVPLV